MSADLLASFMSMFDGSDEARQDYLKMPWGYPGNKFEELAKILPNIPYRERYGEPFGGSGVVLANRRPSKFEVFNDRYSGMTDLLRVVRDPQLLPKLLERLELTCHSREEFIWCKSSWKNCQDPIERAARFYYVLRFAVNSKPNSTFGRSTLKGLSASSLLLHKALPRFQAIHDRYKAVLIENLDWRRCLLDFDTPDMVWYLDPTYLGTSNNYEHELSVQDHKELVLRIQNLKGFVAVSSFDNIETNAVYDKAGVWDHKYVWERTSSALTHAFQETNNFANKETDSERRKVRECLWVREN